MRIARQDVAIVCVLVLGTFALYVPALGNGFVDYDDTMYVGQNEHVLGGLTLANVRWAFGSDEHPDGWSLSLSLLGLHTDYLDDLYIKGRNGDRELRSDHAPHNGF